MFMKAVLELHNIAKPPLIIFVTWIPFSSSIFTTFSKMIFLKNQLLETVLIPSKLKLFLE